jgi:autotransporter-associated beta strand protein
VVNVGLVEVSLLPALQWVSPGGAEFVNVSNATSAASQTVTAIQRKANLVGPNVQVVDVASLVIDTGFADSTTFGDTVRLSPSGYTARGLRNLTLLTGAANDVVSLPSEALNLPVSGGTFIIDMGTGLDRLEATGNTDVTLNGDTLVLGNRSGHAVTLRGLAAEEVKLTGGIADNRFTIQNWTGKVTLDGAAGNDGLAASMRGGNITAIDPLTLATDVATLASGSTATLQGNFLMGSVARTFNIADGTAATDFLLDGTLAGANGLIKIGSGTMQLRQASDYSGTTSILAGVFIVDSTIADSAISLAGGTLRGVTQSRGITSTRGELGPGIGTGITNVRGNLNLNSLSTVRLEINGLRAGSATGGYDVLNVDGTVSLGNAILSTSVGFSSTVGNVYTVLDNDGTEAIVGTFSGLAERALFVANGFTFRISYVGGTGNDVTLTHISNTAPAFQNRSLTPSVQEGGEVVLFGLITEPDSGDLFTLEINWGDGTPLESLVFDPARGREVTVRHRYADDHPLNRDSDVIDVAVLWKDQHGASNSAVMQTRVINVAPEAHASLDLRSLSAALLIGHGQFADLGNDAWTATVDYGDGAGPEPLFLALDQTFRLQHNYTRPGAFEAIITIQDDDGGTANSRIPIRILQEGSTLFGATWHNMGNPLDVDNNGSVTPLDALLAINRLNLDGAIDLISRISEFDFDRAIFYDTNADGFLSPLDSLLVINFLNIGSSVNLGSSVYLGSSGGEGEADETTVGAIEDLAAFLDSNPAARNQRHQASHLEPHRTGIKPARVTGREFGAFWTMISGRPATESSRSSLLAEEEPLGKTTRVDQAISSLVDDWDNAIPLE